MSDLLAFVFPGQGSQKAGMGAALAAEFPAARRIFAAADEALGEPLSALCFDGPDDQLALTANTQPAILTCSVAAWTVVREELGLVPGVCLGHSLGEFLGAGRCGRPRLRRRGAPGPAPRSGDAGGRARRPRRDGGGRRSRGRAAGGAVRRGQRRRWPGRHRQRERRRADRRRWPRVGRRPPGRRGQGPARPGDPPQRLCAVPLRTHAAGRRARRRGARADHDSPSARAGDRQRRRRSPTSSPRA